MRAEVESLIDEHKHDLFGYHNLRTRRAGSQKLIDFHLTVCKDLSVEEAHDITDFIERKIAEKIKGSDVTIHVEPCSPQNCPGRTDCPASLIRSARDNETSWWQDISSNADKPSPE